MVVVVVVVVVIFLRRHIHHGPVEPVGVPVTLYFVFKISPVWSSPNISLYFPQFLCTNSGVVSWKVNRYRLLPSCCVFTVPDRLPSSLYGYFHGSDNRVKCFLGARCKVKKGLMWRPRPSVRPSLCDLVSVTKSFARFSWSSVWEFFTKNYPTCAGYMKIDTLTVVF
jgi:hypothetical protein